MYPPEIPKNRSPQPGAIPGPFLGPRNIRWLNCTTAVSSKRARHFSKGDEMKDHHSWGSQGRIKHVDGRYDLVSEWLLIFYT